MGGIWAGTAAGGKAGAAIGTAIAPGIGTAIGGILGGVAGAIGGDKLGSWLGEEWRKDAYILEKKLRDCAYDLDEKDEVIIKLKQENRDLKSKLKEYHFLEKLGYAFRA